MNYGRIEQKYDLLHPWLEDEGFMNYYKAVQNYTLVDVTRCYELWTLVEACMHLPGDVLEVGAWRGGSAAILARRIADRKHLFVADTFTGVVKPGSRDNRYRGGEHADTDRSTVESLLSDYKQWSILEGIFPEESAKPLEGAQICFCHIDVDVYLSARDTTYFVWERMPIGAIIVYDDYGFSSCRGVRTFVDEFAKATHSTFIYNLNGHGILIKTA